MGQKTHPYGFRLGVIKSWTSKWYEDSHYKKWLHDYAAPDLDPGIDEALQDFIRVKKDSMPDAFT